MKRIHIFSIAIFLLVGHVLQAQNDSKKLHVKVKKELNGVMTEVDTVIFLAPGKDYKEVVKELGIGLEEGLHTHAEGLNVWVNKDGEKVELDPNHERIFLEAGEMTPEKKAEIESMLKEKGIVIEGLESLDGQTNVFVHKTTEEGEGPHKKMRINVEVDAQGNSWNSEGGNVHVMKIEGGSAETTDGKANVFVFDKGEGERKVKVVINGEDIGPETVNFWESEGDGEKIMEELQVQVEVTEDGESKDVHVLKSIKINIFVEDLHAEDEQVLKDAGLRLGDNLAVENLSFYPNPSSGQFTLGFASEEAGNLEVRITDITGRKVFGEERTGFSGLYQNEINISTEPKGIYLLSIRHNGKILNKRLVVE